LIRKVPWETSWCTLTTNAVSVPVSYVSLTVVFYCRLQVRRNYELVALISPFGRRTLKKEARWWF
jgi:hypothetical protein